MSLQELLDIACRHFTAMADAMVAACVTKACETGELIDLRRSPARGAPIGIRPREDVDWERLVVGNADTRETHV